MARSEVIVVRGAALNVPGKGTERRWADAVVLAIPALVLFVAHLLVAGNYGYFRDELYYIVAGQRLAWGYVDFPPMIAVLAAGLRVVSGDSLIAIHVLPALAAALLVFITGWMARELGGVLYAQFVAAVATLVALAFLGTGSIFSMDVLDELWWALGAAVVIRLIKRDELQLWLIFGLVMGLGLFTKLTILTFGFALTVGLLLTSSRRYFATPWPWLGGALALLFLVPYALWNAAHGWPTIQFWHNYAGVATGGNPLDFLANQIFLLNPLTFPIWLAGLYFYLRTGAGKPYRVLGWTYLVLFILFAFAQVKSYFLAPAYPMLFAGGGVVLVRLLDRRPLIEGLTLVVLLVSGILLAPLAMPALPPATFIRFYGRLSGVGGATPQNNTQGRLPQYLADRFGWSGMVSAVTHAYHALPPQQQKQACVFAFNYGEASALTFLGRAEHLPPVISGHNNYYLWGPDRCSGRVMVTVGLSRRQVAQSYASIARAATITCIYCMPEENDLPVYIARQPKAPPSKLWSQAKHFN